MSQSSNDQIPFFLIVLGAILGIVAVLFAFFLWLNFRAVFVILALMLAWYFVGKSFSKTITSHDVKHEEENALLAVAIVQLEEKTAATEKSHKEESAEARDTVHKKMENSISELEKEMQEVYAAAGLFDLKMLRTRAANEIFGLGAMDGTIEELKKAAQAIQYSGNGDKDDLSG